MAAHRRRALGAAGGLLRPARAPRRPDGGGGLSHPGPLDCYGLARGGLGRQPARGGHPGLAARRRRLARAPRRAHLWRSARRRGLSAAPLLERDAGRWPPPSMGPGRDGDSSGSGAEAFQQQPVAQAPVTHGQRVLAQPLHDGPHDAGTGQDDVRPLGLQADDRASPRGIPSSSTPSILALDLRERVQHAALRPRRGRSGTVPSITAVRLVMAPPMPTRPSARGSATEAGEVGSDGVKSVS